MRWDPDGGMVLHRGRMGQRGQIDQDLAVMGRKPRMEGLMIFTPCAVIDKILF